MKKKNNSEKNNSFLKYKISDLKLNNYFREKKIFKIRIILNKNIKQKMKAAISKREEILNIKMRNSFKKYFI